MKVSLGVVHCMVLLVSLEAGELNAAAAERGCDSERRKQSRRG